jgi:small subunit ribosomal protein S24e
MKQISEVEEKILDRKTVVYAGEYKSTTPSRKELQEKVAALNKVKPEMVVIKKIKTDNGSNNVEITAQVYTNEKTYKAIVPKSLAKKSGAKVAEKKGPKTEK